MASRVAKASWAVLLAGACAAEAQDIGMLNMPCYGAYRFWFQTAREDSPPFKVPDGFTEEECANAIKVHTALYEAESAALDRARAESAALRESEAKAQAKLAAEEAKREARWRAEDRARDRRMQADLAAAQRERKRLAALPGVRIGMTKDEVLNASSWGRPQEVRRTTTRDKQHEQWFYGGRNFLYFENGVLVTIQN